MSTKAPTPQADTDDRLSVAGIVIGVIGCVIITASSVYTALKIGALPWPTIFTSITALVLLRACGRRSLNEANVTQIIMSAGSMVAGGIAFTIPGIWILGLNSEVSWVQMLAVALSGTLLGLVCTALIRKRMVEQSDLEYPIGVAAAQTLKASNAGGKTARKLFGSMGLAGLYAVVRDVFGLVPAPIIGGVPIAGISVGIYNNLMLLSVGFLVGGAAMVFWLVAALFANFGIVAGGSSLGLWTAEAAAGIKSSLGIGLMMGSGLGVVLRDILPRMAKHLRGESGGDDALDEMGQSDKLLLGLFVVGSAMLACFGLGLGLLPTLIILVLGFVTTIMSAQSVGQTGIDPMEIFGLIVMLAVAALGGTDQMKLFFIAGIVAVACGLGGDVMSDFKTGQLLGTNPRKMWVGQALGALIGCFVAVAVVVALVSAFGTDVFGADAAGNPKMFVATQASAVAQMVSGIPSLPAFGIGLAGGIVFYCLGLPSMMIGLGVYLPLAMSLVAPLGALAKVIYDRLGKKDVVADGELSHDDAGIVVASGILGGESIVGVMIALFTVASSFFG